MPRIVFRRITTRSVAAVVFFAAMLGLIGTTLLREKFASQSPLTRSRAYLALAIAPGIEPDRIAQLARDLAYCDPLQAASFVMVGMIRIRQDSAAFDAVHPLMQAAVVRQPGLETPQVWLAADFARRGDYKSSLAMFDKVLSQSSDYAPLLMPALDDLLHIEPGRAAVIQRLQQYPTWRTALLSGAIAKGALPDEAIVKLLSDPVPTRHIAAVKAERMQFISTLAARGEIERAHMLYRQYVGIDARSPLYDGEFRAAKPFTPFGWTLATLTEDYSERVARSAGNWMVRAHSSGKHATVLLEQTVALTPGRWAVHMKGRDAGLAKPQNIQLAVECLVDGTLLASQPLGSLRQDETTIEMAFAVAPGCPLQRLTIRAGENDGSASEIEVLSMKLLGA